LNGSGYLGDGATEYRLDPVKIMDSVSYVSMSLNHIMATKTDNSLWAWGWNNDGQLGDGTMEDRLTSVKIMDSVSSVSAGYAAAIYGAYGRTRSRSYTIATKTDGSFWTWGDNYYGQLGDGSPYEYSIIPVRID